MDILLTAVLCYLAIGAAFFAHPASPAMPDDFNWRRQAGVFRASLPEAHGVPGLVNLYGIESTGLSASLPLADEIVRQLGG